MGGGFVAPTSRAGIQKLIILHDSINVVLYYSQI